MRPRYLIPALTALGLLVSAVAALAFTPSPTHEYEIPGAYEWKTPRSAELTSGIDGDAALDSFQARYGGTWRMLRNEATGTGDFVYGSGIALAEDGDIGGAEEAEALARDFIDQNPALFGVSSAELVLFDAVFGLDKWGVNFYQQFQGVRIERSKVTLVFHKNGRLYAFMSEAFPTDNLSTIPTITVQAATEVAKNGLGYQAGRDAEGATAIRILPFYENGALSLHLAYKIDLRTDEPFGLWSTYVDANSSEILARHDNYESFDQAGNITGQTPDFNPCDGISSLTNRYIRMDEVGVTNSSKADSFGNWTLTTTDSVTSVYFRMLSKGDTRWIKVDHAQGANAQDTVVAVAGQPTNFEWDDTNSRLDERSAWVHGNIAHDWLKGVDPNTTGMDFEVRLLVNNPPGAFNCPGNAQWQGTQAIFCQAAQGFGNTGEIADVVYHEYGHGVNSAVYAGSGFNFTMSEGNADVLATLLNEDPVIGDGFYFPTCNIGIRNANNAYTINSGLPSGHTEGQVIAGFWWDLRGRLIEAHSDLVRKSPDNAGKLLTAELWHWDRRLTKPNDMQAMVSNAFVVDDDDGNLDNGTPNYDDIAYAATNKEFTIPTITEGVTIDHPGLASTTDEVNARTVTATASSLTSGVDPSSVTLNYRVNGGSYTAVPMTDGGGGSFSADIAAQSQPACVQYYISATDSAGHVGFSPPAAQDATPDTSASNPDPFESLHTYEVCKIYDDCEVEGDWDPHASGSTSVGGKWEHGTPVANNSQPGYDMTPDPGVNCFVTGASSGNVNNGQTILLSPVWDLTGSDSVVVKLRRWFVNDLDNPLGGFREDWFKTDISNDSGANWVNVEDTNEGLEAWQERQYNVSDIFGAAEFVQLRFTVNDTATATKVEALVDEIRITSAAAVDVAVESDPGVRMPSRFALHGNEPNPFNPATIIRYDLPRASDIEVSVYDPSGRRVRTLVAGNQPAGRHSVLWDGRNDRGEAVSSGVYLYRMDTDRFDDSRKMVLVK